MQGIHFTIAAVIAFGMVMTTLVVVTSIAIKHKKNEIQPEPVEQQPGLFSMFKTAISDFIRMTKEAYQQGLAEAEAAAQGIPPPPPPEPPQKPSLYEQALANAKQLYGDSIPPNVSALLADLKKAENA